MTTARERFNRLKKKKHFNSYNLDVSLGHKAIIIITEFKLAKL